MRVLATSSARSTGLSVVASPDGLAAAPGPSGIDTQTIAPMPLTRLRRSRGVKPGPPGEKYPRATPPSLFQTHSNPRDRCCPCRIAARYRRRVQKYRHSNACPSGGYADLFAIPSVRSRKVQLHSQLSISPPRIGAIGHCSTPQYRGAAVISVGSTSGKRHCSQVGRLPPAACRFPARAILHTQERYIRCWIATGNLAAESLSRGQCD